MIQSKNTQAEIIDQKIWIKSDDQIWSYDLIELSSDGQRRRKTNSKNALHILAPMPGKVTKIFVKPNDTVTKGQALLVMEAMKMEYTLKSDVDTSVDKVNVELNQNITLGFLMIELKPTVPQKVDEHG